VVFLTIIPIGLKPFEVKIEIHGIQIGDLSLVLCQGTFLRIGEELYEGI